MQITKDSQLAYKKKRKDIPKGTKKEEPVQVFCEYYLKLKGIDFIRIPDQLWFWIKNKCPQWLLMVCSKYLAGWCDVIPIIPISDKYGLVCMVECKSQKGKLHGKQKNMAKRLNYQIVRSEEDVIKTIEEFIKEAEKIKNILTEQ